FRSYNDLYGHHAGDDVLRRVAATLADVASRNADALAGRFGGEEFLALFPATNIATAQKLADGVLEAIAALQIAHGGTPLKQLTASIGVAAISPANQTAATAAAEELVRRASTALYVAKTMGRARAVADEPILAPPPRMARC
ncbi:MAG TPA: GGDEF domain-containing protein, partial [Xanthomonadales bacterium]|nr:GGDEF domain-containing protein [Xanthomonadales bacterium]